MSRMRRILVGLATVAALQCVLSAQVGDSQPAGLAEEIGIRVNDGPLSLILETVQRAGRFTLEISESDRALLPQRITMHLCSVKTADVLKAALAAGGLEFKVVDEKTVRAFKPATPPEQISMNQCRDRGKDILAPLRGIPPPPFLTEPIEPVPVKQR